MKIIYKWFAHPKQTQWLTFQTDMFDTDMGFYNLPGSKQNGTTWMDHVFAFAQVPHEGLHAEYPCIDEIPQKLSLRHGPSEGTINAEG